MRRICIRSNFYRLLCALVRRQRLRVVINRGRQRFDITTNSLAGYPIIAGCGNGYLQNLNSAGQRAVGLWQ